VGVGGRGDGGHSQSVCVFLLWRSLRCSFPQTAKNARDKRNNKEGCNEGPPGNHRVVKAHLGII